VHDPHLRDVIFDSPAVPPVARSGVRTFAHGGVTIAKDAIAGRRAQIVFDHGPLGFMPLAAHGHADALAIWLTIDGEPIFVDAGTYLYFSGGDTRTALRESLAHNTLAVDGSSHSRAATAFNWTTTANAQLVAAERGPEWRVAGAHDGYRKSFGVRHRRRLSRTVTGYAVVDRLEGALQPLPVSLRFLCPAALEVSMADGVVAIGGRDGPLCRIVPPRGFTAATSAAQRSERFGHIAPATQLVFAGLLAGEPATTLIDIVERPVHSRHGNDRIARAASSRADVPV
jgi:hypothetical protein